MAIAKQDLLAPATGGMLEGTPDLRLDVLTAKPGGHVPGGGSVSFVEVPPRIAH